MISIIIPVYNVERYIVKCLESVKNQTYSNFEAIIVNDGSTDKSRDLIKKFVYDSKDKRFNLIDKPNGGLSDARNHGVKYAKGDFLIFLDSDDYWDKGVLMAIKNEFNKDNNLEIVKFPKRIVDEREKEISVDRVDIFHSMNGEKAIEILRNNKITFETAWLYMFKMEYWKKNNYMFSIGRLHEDLGLIPRVILQSKNISSINTSSYYNYRQRANSITSTKNISTDLKKLHDLMYFFSKEKVYISKKQYSKKVKKIYIQYYADAVLKKYLSLPNSLKSNEKTWIRNQNVLSEYPIYSFKSIIKYIYYLLKF